MEHFADRGWDVVALARSPMAGGGRVRWARYDLAAAPPDQLLAGVDALVHAAYVKADASPDAYRLNVDGTAALLRARRAAGVSRAVFLSSLSARPGATSVYARQKLDAEALFAAGDDAVIRAGLVLGPGGLVGDTVALMRRVRVVPVIGGGRQPVQPVGIEDLATIVERIVTRDDLAGTLSWPTRHRPPRPRCTARSPAPSGPGPLRPRAALDRAARGARRPSPEPPAPGERGQPARPGRGDRGRQRSEPRAAGRGARPGRRAGQQVPLACIRSSSLITSVPGVPHAVPATVPLWAGITTDSFRRSPATGPCWRRGSPAGSPRSRS